MPNQIKSLSKGLKVYRFIVDYGKPILAVTLCEKLQIDKSTMSRLLKTLKNEDFISYLEKSNEIIANDISNKTNEIQNMIKSISVSPNPQIIEKLLLSIQIGNNNLSNNNKIKI